MGNDNNNKSVSFWVERDDKGNITDWEMTFKPADLIEALPGYIHKLKQKGEQAEAERCEGLLRFLTKLEKNTHKNKNKDRHKKK